MVFFDFRFLLLFLCNSIVKPRVLYHFVCYSIVLKLNDLQFIFLKTENKKKAQPLVSIQRLCRFEPMELRRIVRLLRVSIQRLCRFELITLSQNLILVCFNTTLVSVRASPRNLLYPPMPGFNTTLVSVRVTFSNAFCRFSGSDIGSPFVFLYIVVKPPLKRA